MTTFDILLPSRSVALLLAHQGGWDEALFVLLPIVVFAVLLALANKRAASSNPIDDEPDDAGTVQPPDS